MADFLMAATAYKRSQYISAMPTLTLVVLLDYTLTMRSLVATFALICSFCVAAIEPPTEEELAGAEEAPLEFGEIVVTGSQFTFEQEVAFRLVRYAMNTPRSDKREDRPGTYPAQTSSIVLPWLTGLWATWQMPMTTRWKMLSGTKA